MEVAEDGEEILQQLMQVWSSVKDRGHQESWGSRSLRRQYNSKQVPVNEESSSQVARWRSFLSYRGGTESSLFQMAILSFSKAIANVSNIFAHYHKGNQMKECIELTGNPSHVGKRIQDEFYNGMETVGVSSPRQPASDEHS